MADAVPSGYVPVQTNRTTGIAYSSRSIAWSSVPSNKSSLSSATFDYTLLLDISSVGRAPLRVFEARGIFAGAIDLTNAESESYTNGVRRVPLRDVIGAAQVVLQTARLKVASGLDLAETLVADLIGFDPKPVARDMDLRGGRNADLVLALAVAVWWGDHQTWTTDMSKINPLAGGRSRGAYSWLGV